MATTPNRPQRRRRTPTRRSKTYTGCWSCRKRGMKCDERPTFCRRCEESGVACEGYDFKLVWKEDPKNGSTTQAVQRRSMFDGSESRVTALRDSEIDRALETLDEETGHSLKTLGPFAVFSVAPQSRKTSQSGNQASRSPALKPTSQGMDGMRGSVGFAVSLTDRFLRLPITLSPLSWLPSNEEQRMMDDWLRSMSEIMFPIGNGAQNPIAKIIYVMANSPPPSPEAAVNQSALRHGIFALGAFNRAEMFPETASYRRTAIRQYQLSLRYLRQSLAQERTAVEIVILSSILAIAAIGIVVGDFSDWRIHLRGARQWIMDRGAAFWNQTQDMSLIYQLFLFVDGIGSLKPLERGNVSAQVGTSILHCQPLASPASGMNDHYRLDALFGITQPLLKIITEINHLASLTAVVSSDDIDALRARIHENRPLHYISEGASIPYSEALRYTYFYACLIHLERALRRLSPGKVGDLVGSIIGLLQTAEQLEDEIGCCAPGDVPKVPYPVWPIFIAACEAEEPAQRDILLRWLKKGRLIGLGNMLSAAKICEEVWRRRDDGADVYWYNVMLDMKLDVLLL